MYDAWFRDAVKTDYSPILTSLTGITDQLKQILDQLKLLPVELDESGKPEAVKTKVQGKVNVDTVDVITKVTEVMAVTKVEELVKITDKVNVDTIDVLTKIENKINVETVDTITKVDAITKVDELSKLVTSEEEPLWTQVKSSELNPVHVKFGEGSDPIRVKWEDQEVKVRNPIIEGDVPLPMPLIIAGIETDPLHPNKDNGMKVEIIKSVVLPVDIENEVQLKEPVTVLPPQDHVNQPFFVNLTNDSINTLAIFYGTITGDPIDVNVKNAELDVNVANTPTVNVGEPVTVTGSVLTAPDGSKTMNVQPVVVVGPEQDTYSIGLHNGSITLSGHSPSGLGIHEDFYMAHVDPEGSGSLAVHTYTT